MSVDVDFFPHLLMKDSILTTQYDRRNSWTMSVSSSSSSSSTAAITTTTTNTTSWFERKLFSHFKRFFRRKSLSLISNRRISLSNIENILSLPVNETQKVEEEEEEEEEKEKEEKSPINNDNEKLSLSKISSISNSIDLLYDYNRLLERCIKQHEHNHTTKINVHCQTPISIPHADLIINQICTIIINWKSYIRLFHSLKRDPHLFQQYINQYYSCQSFINQREQLTLNIRTTKTIFDNVLRKFLDDYITCLICQTAQTYLIKSDRIWRIECQLCGIQRIVKRLKWKHHQ
ncbi:unnamed protein product [Rotaria sordida]|uniref:Translation initiation factor IF2/IF5 domain-containing protein n=1 Tax=Rotaria sordida TaxID=392033 RepID=A0A819FD07_9BILA|nr:unnamed protein product [Rotaria sordida]CAF3863526.1 unnamed protein product [Rotaria sordida]